MLGVRRQVQGEAAPEIGQQPVLGRKQIRPNRVQVHVIASRAQIAIAAALHQLRLVAAAQDVSHQVVAAVEPNGVGALQPSHARHQIGVRSFERQVIVVAHQEKRVNLPIGLLAGFSKGLDEVVPLDVAQEDVLALVATTHNVIDGTRILQARPPWHEPRFMRSAL